MQSISSFDGPDQRASFAFYQVQAGRSLHSVSSVLIPLAELFIFHTCVCIHQPHWEMRRYSLSNMASTTRTVLDVIHSNQRWSVG